MPRAGAFCFCSSGNASHFQNSSLNMGLAKIPVEHGSFRSFAIKRPSRVLSLCNLYLPNGAVILTISTRVIRLYLIHAIHVALFPGGSSKRAPMVCGGSEAGPWTSSPRHGGWVSVSSAEGQCSCSGPARPPLGSGSP
jgi:hypothetical protein